MKKVEWWRGTANNAFRTYFYVISEGRQDRMTPSEQKKYVACDKVFREADEQLKHVLTKFYSAKWGDDRYFVEDYSEKIGIDESFVWIMINSARRAVMEELGLLDRRERKNE